MSNARELAELSGSYGAGGFVGMKNRIINGAMVIDKRNEGAAINLASTPFAVDRFGAAITTILFTGKGTVQRSTTAPSGFTNSLLFTQTTGVSPSAAQIATLYQGIEGYNIADFSYGTAAAKTSTLSFWVRSSVVGTYCVGLRNGATDRSYVAEYSISSANTWEQKTITIAGDTSGTWTTDNTAGMFVTWDLGSGSDSNTTAGAWQSGNFRRTSNQVGFVGNSGATFYVTGVQLEKGSTATSFDYRLYGTDLALCQRYYLKLVPRTLCVGYNTSGYAACNTVSHPVTMRSEPTASFTLDNYNGAPVSLNQSHIYTSDLKPDSHTLSLYWGAANYESAAAQVTYTVELSAEI
jgi:hypothetical protein